MSYDLSLIIDTGGPEPAIVADIGNYTSNVSEMWALALTCGGATVRLRDLHGFNAGSAVPILTAAVSHMLDPRNEEAYRALEPSNKWGRLEGAREFLAKLLEACKKHPKAVIDVSC